MGAPSEIDAAIDTAGDLTSAAPALGLFELALEVGDLAATERFNREGIGLTVVNRWGTTAWPPGWHSAVRRSSASALTRAVALGRSVMTAAAPTCPLPSAFPTAASTRLRSA